MSNSIKYLQISYKTHINRKIGFTCDILLLFQTHSKIHEELEGLTSQEKPDAKVC